MDSIDGAGEPRTTDAVAFLRDMVQADPELQAEYERLGPRFMVIGEIIRARKRLGLTQRAMAERMGVSQPVVARLLSGEQSPRIDTIAAAAAALDCELVIELRPRASASRQTPPMLAAVAEDAPTYRTRAGGRRRSATSGRAALDPS